MPWRVVRLDAAGTRCVGSYASREEAERWACALRATAEQAAQATIGDWIERVNLPPKDARRNALLRLFRAGKLLDVAPGDVSEPAARAAYKALLEYRRENGQTYAAASQHMALRSARWMWRLLIDEGLASENPWCKVRLEGRAKKGKPQLRRDDAVRWLDAAWERAWQGDSAALGCVIGLFCGLRLGETQGLQARDVMDEGRVLHVEGTKTEEAVRDMEIGVPALARLLVVHAAGRQPTGRLVPCGEHLLRGTVKQLAEGVGVPAEEARRLTYQSLRGMAETLARRGGGIPELVARGLAHTLKVANEHYVAPGTDDAIRQLGVSQALPNRLQVVERKEPGIAGDR